jgi:trigger factor
LNISQEFLSPLEIRLTLTLGPEDYRPRVEKGLKEVRKNIKMPGFRPGMVPDGLIRKQYGLSVLQEEMGKLVNDHLMDYARQNNMDFFGQPLPVAGHEPFPNGLEDGLTFDFQYDLGLRPKVELQPFQQSFDKAEPQPGAAEVDELIEQWRSRYFEGAYPDTAEAGDRIFLRLTPSEDQDLHGQSARKGVTLVALDEIVQDALKADLMGKGKGFTGTLTPHDLYGDHREAIAKGFKLNEGETLDPQTRFDFEVSNILREGKADLNEAFFAKVFGASMDEAEFRSRTEEFIKAGWDQEAEQLLRFRMMEKFFDEYPMDLPDAFLRRLIKDDKQGHDHDHHDHAGHDHDHADHDHSGHDHNHDAPGNPYESFAKQLRRDLVIDVLLKNHRVEITREDLLQEAEERLFRQFSSYGISPEQIPLRKYAEDYLRKESNESSVYYNLKYRKAEDILREQIQTVSTAVDYPTFKAEWDSIFAPQQ